MDPLQHDYHRLAYLGAGAWAAFSVGAAVAAVMVEPLLWIAAAGGAALTILFVLIARWLRRSL